MVLEHLRQLVEIESISGNEKAALEYISGVITTQGHECFQGESWVATKLSSNNNTEALIINGHVDTVPPGDITAWKNNPYSLTQDGDKLTGLGVTDMKSGIACMLSLLSPETGTPAMDIWLVFVAGEETNGHGTAEFVTWFKENHLVYESIDALVAEPTGIEYIGIGHRGNMAFTVTAHGQGGHASRPNEIKEHAVLKAYDLIAAYTKLNKEWGEMYVHPELGSPAVTVTAVSTGHSTAANQIPTTCTLSLDVRTTPEIAGSAAEAIESVALSLEGVKVNQLTEPFVPVTASPSSAIVKRLLRIVPELHTQSFPGATDLSFMQEIATNCIVFGPGDETQMHVVDESIPERNLERYIQIIRKLIASP